MLSWSSAGLHEEGRAGGKKKHNTAAIFMEWCVDPVVVRTERMLNSSSGFMQSEKCFVNNYSVAKMKRGPAYQIKIHVSA